MITDRTGLHLVLSVPLLIKTIQPEKKAYFIFKTTGPAIVRLASSDFWNAPLDSSELTKTLFAYSQKIYTPESFIVLFHQKG